MGILSNMDCDSRVMYMFNNFCQFGRSRFGAAITSEDYKYRNVSLNNDIKSRVSMSTTKIGKIESIVYPVWVCFKADSYIISISRNFSNLPIQGVSEKFNNLIKSNLFLSKLFSDTEISNDDDVDSVGVYITREYRDNADEQKLLDDFFSQLNFIFDIVSDFYAVLFGSNENSKKRLDGAKVCIESIMDTISSRLQEFVNKPADLLQLEIDMLINISLSVLETSVKNENPCLAEFINNPEFKNELVCLVIEAIKSK